jgi:hypothetical protein
MMGNDCEVQSEKDTNRFRIETKDNTMTVIVKEVQTEEQKKQSERRAELEAELAKMGRNPNIRFQLVEFKHKKTGENQVGINIHGVTAKPMFVYGSQAEALVSVAGALQEFVNEQRTKLSWKK